VPNLSSVHYWNRLNQNLHSMKLSNLCAVVTMLVVFLALNFGAQAQIWSESFETDGEGTNYVSSNTFYETTSDHFGRTDGTNVSGAYVGFDGSFFWAGEDWDDTPLSDGLRLKTLTFQTVDITGLSDLQFSGLFATEFVAGGWDDSDTLRVEYAVDGGAWNTLLTTAAPTGVSGSNIGMWMDTDGDNVGDVEVSPTFQTITKAFSVSGTALVVRVYVNSPSASGSESFAFDLFSVSNVAGAISGCTDPSADNYNPAATLDDGSCIISGCTNATADNFNPAANNDDGSCIIQGCTDAAAVNYNPDATNDDGSCILSLPNLIITEIHYNGIEVGTDVTEFIEIYNADAVAIDLEGLVLIGVDFTFPAGASIAPGEYIVVVVDATNPIFAGAAYQIFQWTTGGLGNGGEAVGLALADGTVINEVVYDDAAPWPTEPDGFGPSVQLSDLALDNTDGANWCPSNAFDGTPGAANLCLIPVSGCTNPAADNYDPAANVDDGTCIISGCTDPTAINYNVDANNDDGSCTYNVSGCTDPTAVNYNAAATIDDGSCVFTLPAIVINEIHYNPCGTQGADNLFEYLELYNNDVVAVDLAGWNIDGFNVTFPVGTSIAPGEYIVIAIVAATYEGNGYQVFEATGQALGNGGEPLALLNDAGIVVDAVTYDTGTLFPNANGNCASLELIDANTDNADGANWQASYVDNGTPGAANSTVPPFTEYTISELQSELYTGEGVTTSGVVTAVYGASNLFTMQDGSGPNSGIWVSGAGVALGDEVEVDGVVVETYTLTQINSENITILTSGNALPNPEVLSTLAAGDEQWEGVLVQVTGEVPLGGGDVGFGEWSVDDASGAVLVDDLGITVTPVDEGVTFRVTGPLYFSFGNFKIEPRDAADIERFGCTDISFPNYDALATVDDGSCADIPGCTNPAATNYDPAATADDGTCIVEGCTDPTALNYDITATIDNGTCYFTEPLIIINEIHYNPCFDQGDDLVYEFVELYNADVTAVDLSGWVVGTSPILVFAPGTSIAAGEYIVLAMTPTSYEGNGYQVFDLEGSLGNGGTTVNLTDNFGNLIDEVVYDDITPWPTNADGFCSSLELIDVATDNNNGANWQDSYVPNGTPGAANSTIPEGCTDPLASNYDANALQDDGSCEYAGCTNPDALNYDVNATTDDGSCLLLGCTYDVAENYDPIATVDDGSCTFAINPCPSDFNGDGVVNAGDLLVFLSDFGSTCE